jgi:hypothetical protein
MITDQHLNTGAMALGALPEEEAVLFVEHLDTCAECASELSGFLETASALGGSVAQTPPASLRRSVMAAVAQTPQLPPLTLTGSALGRHREAAEVATVEAAAAASAATGTEELPGRAAGTEKLADVIPMRRPWYRRPQALLAAAVAVLVIGGGTTLVVANNSTGPSKNVASCLASASDKSTLSPSVGSGGAVTLAPSCDTAVVRVPSLPDAPSGKVYQLWVIKGTGAGAATASVGVLKKKADGSYSSVDADVRAGDTAVAVTVEPGPAGSARPTTTPLWVVPLTT